MRVAVGVEYAKKSGLEIGFGEAAASPADVLVVGKIGADCRNGRDARWLDAVKSARSRGGKIVLDYTDNHLDSGGPMSDFYKSIIGMVDRAVVPSAHMKALLSRHWPGAIEVVADAIEVPTIPPKSRATGPTPTVLWFGHGSNIGYLADYLDRATTAHDAFRLIVLSNRQGLEAFGSHASRSKARIDLALGEWSVTNMLAAAQVSDACIIPSDASDPRKSGAGSNRLITAFAMGLPTAAENLASYAPYAEYFVDLRRQPLAALIADPRKFAEAISKAQRDIVPSFRPDVLGKAWLDALR